MRTVRVSLTRLTTTLLALAPAPLPAQSSPLTPFHWLPGCWQGTIASGAVYEEWWMPERGGTMLGSARLTREGRTLSTELMVLRVEDGVPVYVAQPSGAAAPTRFPLAQTEEARWVFENRAHDFPQRIIYTNPAGGRGPFARIEGESGGSVRSMEFPLARVTCPAVTASDR